jgi:hypothetical protein
MTFIINNLGWISIPIIIFIMAILLNKLVIIIGEEKARAYKSPLTFEEFKKRGLDK